VGVFGRGNGCRTCGQQPVARLSPALDGASGDVAVTLTHFPHAACVCGRRRRQAFDVSDLVDALLLWHVPSLRHERRPLRRRTCGGCGGRMSRDAERQPFTAEPRVGAHTYRFSALLPAFACVDCGLCQIDARDATLRKELAAALAAALAGYGLPAPQTRTAWLARVASAEGEHELRARLLTGV